MVEEGYAQYASGWTVDSQQVKSRIHITQQEKGPAKFESYKQRYRRMYIVAILYCNYFP